MNTPENVKKLKRNEFFVAGTNIAGYHAGGAARTAWEKFGLKTGVSEGLCGKTYAFPTLNADGSKRTMAELEKSRDLLFACAKANPENTFLLTRVGCGIAGFDESEISPLFEFAPPNVAKPEGWDRKLWKFLRTGMKSDYGDCKWKEGEWKKENVASLCRVGFHASEKALDAFRYVNGEVLARVEARGAFEKSTDKECWTEMRVVDAYEWTKEESVRLALFSAGLVIGIWEKEYPDDKRPREAIKAAEMYLESPSNKNAHAAYAATRAADAAHAAAYAARAAHAAARAADAAARAAHAAADAAYATDAAADAARAADAAAYAADAAADATDAALYAADAAEAAAYATRAADTAAYAADAADARDKIESYITGRIKFLKKI